MLFSSFKATQAALPAACGRERWAAKVLTAGATIDPNPRNISIDDLRALARPSSVDAPDAPRVSAERRVYRVQTQLLSFKLERDGDIHLIVAQPGERMHTMVAEIPNPACMSGAPSEYIRDVTLTRRFFVRAFGIPSPTRTRVAGHPLTIYGPAFFDAPHGQDGAAPNGVEIHPVLYFD